MTKYEVEVYVEDLYFSSHNQTCPIDMEQWQLWANIWLNSLDLSLDSQPDYEFTLLLTDDRYIHQLNKQFRQQDKPTDVLAFASLETDFPTPEAIDSVTLGDIIISVETAERQANDHQHSLQFELAWLAVHGFLHLLGWDHPDDQSLTKMLKQQEVLLKAIAISVPNFTFEYE